MTRTKKKQPTKSQRKVAAAPTLRQTLSDATTATRGKRLIELAVRSADRYSPKRQNWFDRFSESKPRLAAEMLELVHDWLAGGPTRNLTDWSHGYGLQIAEPGVGHLNMQIPILDGVSLLPLLLGRESRTVSKTG